MNQAAFAVRPAARRDLVLHHMSPAAATRRVGLLRLVATVRIVRRPA